MHLYSSLFSTFCRSSWDCAHTHTNTHTHTHTQHTHPHTHTHMVCMQNKRVNALTPHLLQVWIRRQQDQLGHTVRQACVRHHIVDCICYLYRTGDLIHEKFRKFKYKRTLPVFSRQQQVVISFDKGLCDPAEWEVWCGGCECKGCGGVRCKGCGGVGGVHYSAHVVI